MNYLDVAKEVFQNESEGIAEMTKNLDEQFNDSIRAILETQGRVVITGMGKSGLVGKKIAATMASTGTRTFFMHPGEAYHGDLGMIHPSDVIIAISNSGETDEVIKLLSFFKSNGNKVISMTGKPDSTLAKHGDFHLNVGVTSEACHLQLAPTTSTTVTMVMGDAIAVALMKAKDFREENFAQFHPGGSLGRRLLTTVKDVMRSDNLPVLKSNDSFEQIISIITQGKLGLGVVMDSEIIGVITDGDIRRVLSKESEKALKMTAIDICSKNPVMISDDKKLVDAEQMMQERKITALLVGDKTNLSGVLQLYDIAR